ncbi:sucrase-isomaltase, intestinal-like isoform X2 [Apostichopus japonicus]|uniref:sucrase-isomaltase, intestinal-like isoform X2 n=1 Tax=Stichopus japonicus TaxID=307972 RepID=UPI003AB5BC25
MGKLVWVVVSICVLMVFALALGLGLGLGLQSDEPDVDQDYFLSVRDEERIDCYPDDEGKSIEACEGRGCFWKEPVEDLAPECFHPPTHGYDLVSIPEDTELGWSASLELRERPERYQRDVINLKLDVEMQTTNRMRFKFSDADNDRFEVPIPVASSSSKASNPAYNVQYGTDPTFGLKITRTSTGTVVFDSRLPGFTFDDQFLQISTRFPTANIYGFGEHIHERYRHDLNWKTWGIFSRDTLPLEDRNLYGHHPFYLCVEKDGNAHGLFLLNSNAMDVTLLPGQILTYRVIGGVLDFYLFMGPSPENVVQQYLELIGRPVMPPYWALGFHLSKWDYGNLTVMRDVVESMRANDMPHDVQYADIDYMDEQRSFTVDPINYVGLGEFIDDVHAHGQRFIIILDHTIAKMETYEPYTRGHELDVFIKYNSDTNEELIGRDMNEPSNMIDGSVNGCGEDRWNRPPYLPKLYKVFSGTLYEETLCMDSDHHGSTHYNVHSLYGHSHAKATHRALEKIFPDKRSFVLTRSNFPSTSRYAGHWLGDNKSQWVHMRWSVIGMIEFGLFGFPFIGADICGFIDDTTEEMCQRWMQLGAFYPFARNHNARDAIPQHPTVFSETMTNVSRDILLHRYTLIPFLYTLFYEANTQGSTVVRSLMHEFPSNVEALHVEEQFLWGPSLLITPVMKEADVTVRGYFPDVRWYSYYSGEELPEYERGTWVTLSAPLDFIPVHVRGGYILPTQEPANTTVYSRRNPLGLIVALNDEQRAAGNLYWDDGESRDPVDNGAYSLLEFTVNQRRLSMSVIRDSYVPPDNLAFSLIKVFGLDSAPSSIEVDSVTLSADSYTFDADLKVLIIEDQTLAMLEDHIISWNN